MKLYYTGYSFVVFVVGMLALLLLLDIASSRIQYLRIRRYRKLLAKALLINIIGFYAVSLAFVNIYGFITDDGNYLNFPAGYVQPFFWEITRPNNFMLFIAYPFAKLLGFDRSECHVLFAFGGFIGSAIYFWVYANGIDLREKLNEKTIAIAFWCLFCFPNFMAWGRFFGKDSLIFTAAAFFMLSAKKMLTDFEFDLKDILILIISIYTIQKIRPHIAAALISGLASGMAMGLVIAKNKAYSPSKRRSASRAILSISMLGIAIMFGIFAVLKLTGKPELSIEDAQDKIISSARMGSYGGSATDLGSELDENPTIIFSPERIAVNIFNLYFAPMPWQVGGAYQLIAFISNMLLLVLIIRRWRHVSIKTPWAWFLLFTIGYLTIILSFLTGNVGLAMRQKLIILPFIFMLLLQVDNVLKYKRPASREKSCKL